MKKLGIFTIVSLLLIMGSSLAVEFAAINDRHVANQGETVSYVFTITNADSGRYVPTTVSEYQNWMTIPHSVDLANGNQFTVLIRADRFAEPRTYVFPITLTSVSNSQDTSTQEVRLNVRPKAGVEIESITPSAANYRSDEVITMNLKLKSNEPIAKNVDIVFDIKNPEGIILKTVVLKDELSPDSESSYQQSFDLGELAPGIYSVDVSVRYRDFTYDYEQGSFEISPLVNLVKTKKSSWTFLAIESVIRVDNLGNSPTKDVEVKDTVPSFWSLFVRGAPESSTAQGSDRSYTWKLTEVAAKGSQEVRYQIILWPIYLIVLVLALLSFRGYTSFLMPSVSKSFNGTSNLGEGKEGSVIIHAKNKGLKTLKNVVIDDRIPASFKVIDASVPRPKYRKTGHGAELRWSLGTLAPGEERVFSYKVKNLMGIIGTVELPGAKMIADGNKIYRSQSLKTRGDKHKQVI